MAAETKAPKVFLLEQVRVGRLMRIVASHAAGGLDPTVKDFAFDGSDFLVTKQAHFFLQGDRSELVPFSLGDVTGAAFPFLHWLVKAWAHKARCVALARKT